MNGSAPVQVALYTWGPDGSRVRAAEFRLGPDGAMALTILDPAAGSLAQEIYDHGIDLAAERRQVMPAEGTSFLRALLQPFRMSYYAFVDESAG